MPARKATPKAARKAAATPARKRTATKAAAKPTRKAAAKPTREAAAKPTRKAMAKRAAPAPGARAEAEPRGVRTTSTFSPRMERVWRELDAAVRRVFPEAEAVFDYGMRGWRVPRRIRVEAWKGTMDPNWLVMYAAERAQGITLHLWNPCEYGFLRRKADELAPHGLKAMVGCLQFNRKGDYPVAAVEALLREARGQMEAEAPQ